MIVELGSVIKDVTNKASSTQRPASALFGIVSALLILNGCSALRVIEPDTIRPEFEHISHATQHQPFTTSPTNYGANIASIIAHWDTPKDTYLELGEGMSLDREWYGRECGEIAGPREQFTLRVGYVFHTNKADH